MTVLLNARWIFESGVIEMQILSFLIHGCNKGGITAGIVALRFIECNANGWAESCSAQRVRELLILESLHAHRIQCCIHHEDPN